MAEPQKDAQETANPVPSPVAPVAPASPVATPPAPINTQPAAVTPPAPQVAPVLPDPVAPDSLSFTSEEPTTDIDTQDITWTASEFHVHEKSAGWYIRLAIATIAMAAILYLLTKSILTPIVVVIGGLVLGIYGTHRPGNLEYSLTRQGIRIGSKQYLYDEFRLFIVTPDSSFPEVTLIPTKRFMPSLSVRYAPDDADKILNRLSDHLPVEERRPELIDSLMRHIRF